MPASRFPMIFILVLLCAACAPAPQSSSANTVPGAPARAVVPKPGGTFVRAMTSEPATLDPQGAPNSGLSLVIPYLFDTLVVPDNDNNLIPLLAESWQVAPDGKAVSMKLKAGVTFHDGTAFNAEAVRFTFERFKASGMKSPIYGGIQQMSGVEVVDDLTVRFTFEAPTANFWSTIAMPYAGILSPQSARTLTAGGQGQLVGTGPFVLSEWKTGQSITLRRNPDYRWGSSLTQNRGAPYLEMLVFKVIPEAATQLAALEAGDVDAIFVNQPDHRIRLQSNPTVQLQETVLNSLIYLGFNCKKAPFDDARVRQALSLAVEKSAVVDLALGGIGMVADAPLPPSLPGYTAALKSYALPYDLATAQARLREAGFGRTGNGNWERNAQPLKAMLLTSNRAPNDAIAALLQSQFKALGVPVEIRQLDSKAVMDATTEGKFDLLLWRYDWNDPDALNIYLGSDRIGSTNRVAYANPEVDQLLARGARELNPAQRVQIYVDAQKLILQDAPWQPLYVPLDVLAFSKRIEGVRVGYMGRVLLNDAFVVGQ